MGTVRVLIVDDDPNIVGLTFQILETCGYEVTPAISGEQALEILNSAPPFDLVLSDLVMPGMKGHQLLEAVRHAFPFTALMAMSGYSGYDLPSKVSFLQKPFHVADLIATVRRALVQAAQERADTGSGRATANG